MIEAYIDGCCEPVNPGGVAAYGVVVLRDGGKIYQASKIFLPRKGRERETSNNVAEYSGLKHLLGFLLQAGLDQETIKVYSDSRLVIEQMWGTWRIKAGFYVPIALECRNLLKSFPRTFGQWIPRERNELADELSKAELIRAGVKFRIQPHIANRWWENIS